MRNENNATKRPLKCRRIWGILYEIQIRESKRYIHINQWPLEFLNFHQQQTQ